ncbi:MAG: hypothetical protein CFE26_15395, partial [Verrucomicrobiales bacterium VVV1]
RRRRPFHERGAKGLAVQASQKGTSAVMTWDWMGESMENVDAGRPIKAPARELLEKIDRFFRNKRSTDEEY